MPPWLRLVADGLNAPHFIHCDLRDIEALRSAIAEAGAKHGPVRVLVNNAGNDDRHTTESVTVDYWDNRMQVNLIGDGRIIIRRGGSTK